MYSIVLALVVLLILQKLMGSEEGRQINQLREKMQFPPSCLSEAIIKMKLQSGPLGLYISLKTCISPNFPSFLHLIVCSPFNHFESCLTVRRVGLSPRLR